MENDQVTDKKSGTGTAVSAACCFGALGILGLLGFTTALAYVNRFGDYIFFPAYAAFGTVLVYAMISYRKNALAYLVSIATIGLMLYFSIFGLLWAGLVLIGVIIGTIINKRYSSQSCGVKR